MSDDKCAASIESTPLELTLDRLTKSRTRLDNAVTSVIQSHSSVQCQIEPSPAAIPSQPDAFGSSDLVRRLSTEADEIDNSIDRLYAFNARSEV